MHRPPAAEELWGERSQRGAETPVPRDAWNDVTQDKTVNMKGRQLPMDAFVYYKRNAKDVNDMTPPHQRPHSKQRR
ncbi:hypothetical protein E2C01_046551 [Portunus trituberculatus]|uniref:Uncharacterized protein n=1 Tax=Portunus trituberculatus TaxID=210409 RepID=A0A5B7G5E6_PORTR|nr:hypothetical protein [Portunus trituberculatus]